MAPLMNSPSKIRFYCLTLLLSACGQSDPKTPALEGLGAPDVAWSEKNMEQKFGFMAAAVHPEMAAIFTSYDKTWAGKVTCETCHGPDPELIDYRMPTDQIYSLPEKNTIQEAMDYDEEVTNAMMAKVTPGLKKLLDQGEGPNTKVDCFSCHPKE
jgi:cytochrome c553